MNPKQGRLVENAIQISRWFGQSSKRWNRFPDGQQDLLKPIVAIVNCREPVDHVMENRAVLACPLGKPLLLIGNIHESSAAYEATNGDFLQSNPKMQAGMHDLRHGTLPN